MAKKQKTDKVAEKPDLTKMFEEEARRKESAKEPKEPAWSMPVRESELPKAIQESLARPTDPVTLANETISQDYPWCLPSLTSPQRALLCELIRIRKVLEGK